MTIGILRKRAICAVAAAVLGLSPVVAQAACFNQPEWVAAHVRRLQTELMVAALQCKDVPGRDFTPQYNAFIGKFGSTLRLNTERLKAHFQRAYGNGSSRELDLYITRIANDASEVSMRSVAYCDESVALFQNALLLESRDLEQFSVDRIVEKSMVGEFCGGPRVITAETPKPAATSRKPTAKATPASANAPG